MKWFWQKKKIKKQPDLPVIMGSQTVSFHEPIVLEQVWQESDDVDNFISKITTT